MLIIKCPWCGDRDETEFSYGGEADIKRPVAPETLSDEEWGDYLFMRKILRVFSKNNGITARVVGDGLL